MPRSSAVQLKFAPLDSIRCSKIRVRHFCSQKISCISVGVRPATTATITVGSSAYDALSLKQLGAFNTSPQDTQSAISAADAGFAADEHGNVFVATGNGKFDLTNGGYDYGDSLLKVSLNASGLSVRDYFTPSDQENLNRTDEDLGSGGPVLFFAGSARGASTPCRYWGQRRHCLPARPRSTGEVSQRIEEKSALQEIAVESEIMGAPAFWQNHLFVQSNKDALKDFAFKNGQFSEQPVAQTPRKFTAGATPTVSSDGARNGIVWTVETRPFGFSNQVPAAVLHAYDAGNIARELYNSSHNSARDGAGPSVRFTIPTVINGRAYVGAIKEVDVYGLLASASADSR